jgi:hypothetical protein
LTYPRDYRQERTYGFSAIGVILTLVGVVAIMVLVAFLTGTMVFFPFGNSYEFQPSPDLQTLLPSMLLSSILIAATTLVVIVGSWLYNHVRVTSES